MVLVSHKLFQKPLAIAVVSFDPCRVPFSSIDDFSMFRLFISITSSPFVHPKAVRSGLSLHAAYSRARSIWASGEWVFPGLVVEVEVTQQPLAVCHRI